MAARLHPGGASVASGLAQTGETFLDWLTSDPTGIPNRPGSPAPASSVLDPEGYAARREGVFEGVVDPVEQVLAQVSDRAGELSGQHAQHVPQLQEGLSDQTLGSAPEWILQQAARGAPYMALSALGPVAGPAALGTALTGEIAQDRAAADDRAGEVTPEDLAVGALGAIPSAFLERIGVASVLGKGARTPKIGGSTVAAAGDVARETGRRSGTEALTEALQEPTQYAASSLGTEQGFDVDQALEAAASGALVGGSMGAGLGAPARMRERLNAKQAAAPTDLESMLAEVNARLDEAEAEISRPGDAPVELDPVVIEAVRPKRKETDRDQEQEHQGRAQAAPEPSGRPQEMETPGPEARLPSADETAGRGPGAPDRGPEGRADPLPGQERDSGADLELDDVVVTGLRPPPKAPTPPRRPDAEPGVKGTGEPALADGGQDAGATPEVSPPAQPAQPGVPPTQEVVPPATEADSRIGDRDAATPNPPAQVPEAEPAVPEPEHGQTDAIVPEIVGTETPWTERVKKQPHRRRLGLLPTTPRNVSGMRAREINDIAEKERDRLVDELQGHGAKKRLANYIANHWMTDNAIEAMEELGLSQDQMASLETDGLDHSELQSLAKAAERVEKFSEQLAEENEEFVFEPMAEAMARTRTDEIQKYATGDENVTAMTQRNVLIVDGAVQALMTAGYSKERILRSVHQSLMDRGLDAQDADFMLEKFLPENASSAPPKNKTPATLPASNLALEAPAIPASPDAQPEVPPTQEAASPTVEIDGRAIATRPDDPDFQRLINARGSLAEAERNGFTGPPLNRLRKRAERIEARITERYGDTAGLLPAAEPAAGDASRQEEAKARGTRAVDEQGNPVRVFHGTNAAFGEMRGGRSGSYFTTNPEIASEYAETPGEGETRPNVRPSYLDFHSPAEIDAGGSTYDRIPLAAAQRAFPDIPAADMEKTDAKGFTDPSILEEVARQSGKFDSVIIRNVDDSLSGGMTGDTYVALRADQIISQFTPDAPGRADTTPVPRPIPPEPEGGGVSLRTAQPAQAGENFVGDADADQTQDPVVGATDRRRLRRREELITPVARSLGVNVYKGRLPRSQRGMFDARTGEVRVRAPEDAETAAHELAHLIDSRVYGPKLRENNAGKPERPWLQDEAFADELKAVSYDKQSVSEGFAEAVRLWATQPDQARQFAPKASEFLDGMADRSDQFGKALSQTRDRLRDWYHSEPVERLASKIGDGDRTVGDRVLDAAAAGVSPEVRQGLWRQFQFKVFDDMSGIYYAEKDIHGKGDIAGGAYQNARVARAASIVAEQAIEQGAPKVAKENGKIAGLDFEGKSFLDIIDQVPVRERPDWERYIISRSATETMEQGRENLLSEREIEAGLKLGEQREYFETAFQEYLEWNEALKQAGIDFGIVDPEKAANWQRELYVPFFRVSEDHSQSPGQGSDKSRPGAQEITRRLKGGTANVRNLIQTIQENAKYILSTGIRNNAMREVVDDIQEHADESARWLVKAKGHMQAQNLHVNRIKSTLSQAMSGLPKGTQDQVGKAYDEWAQENGEQVAFWSMVNEPAKLPGERVVAVLRDGKPEYYEVGDELLFNSLQRMTRPVRKGVIGAGRGIRQMVQKGITLNPSFLLRNTLRAELSAVAYSRDVYVPFVDAARGFASRIRRDATYKEWLASGGAAGSISHADDLVQARQRGRLFDFYKQHGISMRSIVHTPLDVLRAYERVSQMTEEAARLSEYRKVKTKTGSRRQAAYASREVGTDFSVRGASDSLNAMQDVVPFLGAAMAGIELFGRTARARPLQMATYAGMLAAGSAALAAFNSGNPWDDTEEDWLKEAHWRFYIPKPGSDLEVGENDDGEFIARKRGSKDKWRKMSRAEAQKHYDRYLMPKFWDVGAIASIAERWTEVALGTSEPGFAAKRTGKIILDQFKLSITPAAVAPAVELWANKSFFTGRAIESPSMKNMPAAERYGPYTSSLSKGVGEATGLSPAKMDHALRSYFGIFAIGAMMASDAVTGNKPTLKLSELPGPIAVKGRTPGRTQAETDLYKAMTEVREAKNSLKAAKEEGDRAKMRDYGPMARRDPEFKSIRKRLSGFRAEERRIQRSAMDPRRKTETLDALRTRKNQAIIAFWDRYKKRYAD